MYEMLWNIAGLLIIHIFSKKSKTKYPGQYFLFYVAWYGLGRFMIEGLRTDSLYIHGTSIRASQLLAALSFLGAAAILAYNHFRAKTPASESSDDEENEDPADDEVDEEAEEADTMEELAELDGASVDELDDEMEDADEDEHK
jgi:phosphatidylglycerol:prolipoprotein diacylglycerol transferase